MRSLKRLSIDNVLRNLSGGDHPSDAVAMRRCLRPPIGCGQPLSESHPFRDRASYDEWRITGLCQACQDALEDEL